MCRLERSPGRSAVQETRGVLVCEGRGQVFGLFLFGVEVLSLVFNAVELQFDEYFIHAFDLVRLRL